jgi:hypothetical protein
MNIPKIKDLMIRSLDHDADAGDISGKLEEVGVSFNFSSHFEKKVLNKLFSAVQVINREVENIKYMNLVFYRIAFTGIAAIVLLLISIYLMEGSISLNSFLGLSDNSNESIVCLLTGN